MAEPLRETAEGSLAAEAPSVVAAGAVTSDIDDPLLKLLEKPPGEVAAWMLDQVKDLGEAENLVESLPIFKIAKALKAAPVEQKEALISNVMRGIGDLPVEQKTEYLHLLTQMPTSADALSPTANLDALQASASSSAEESAKTLLSANFARIAQEAAIAEMPPEEMQKISDVVQKEQGQLIGPMLEVVDELTEEERNNLTNTLVAKGMVSEENRVVLEDTMKPGGSADQVAGVVKWIHRAYRHTWLVWGLPIFEIVLALAISSSAGCSMPVLPWLITDGILAAGVACSAYSIKYVLKSAYKEFSDNPMNMVQQVQAKIAEGAKLNDAVPGANCAGCLIVVMVGLIVIAALLVIMGVIQLLQTIASSCAAGPRLTTIIACAPIMVLRLGLPIVVVLYALKAYRKISELRGQSSGAQPLLPEAEPNYGAVDGPPPV